LFAKREREKLGPAPAGKCCVAINLDLSNVLGAIWRRWIWKLSQAVGGFLAIYFGKGWYFLNYVFCVITTESA
jgi:hypothetical protein